MISNLQAVMNDQPNHLSNFNITFLSCLVWSQKIKIWHSSDLSLKYLIFQSHSLIVQRLCQWTIGNLVGGIQCTQQLTIQEEGQFKFHLRRLLKIRSLSLKVFLFEQSLQPHHVVCTCILFFSRFLSQDE